MTSKEIVDAVISYVRDENAKYAILIDGTWGSGKTYLYENYLVDAIDSVEVGKNERKQNVYISLYGISSIDSLAKQLITNYLIYVKGNGNKLVKKGLKPLAGIIGVASSAFSFSIGPISTDLSNVFEKIEGSIDVKDMVICFDDLERCTIPINEFFGFVNNLIEHCNCKVIILADEKNIGKIYANTNIEEKYLTVISGNRKVVEYIGDGKNIKTKNKGLGKDTNGEITVEEVKKLNEMLYSEYYLYKDIKEKVIGKTMLYYPALKDVIKEVICGNEKSKGIIQEGQYKEYLLKCINDIVSAFTETENRNLRIIRSWIFSFRKIYEATTKYYSNSKYYEEILNDFLRYSIWVAGAIKKNKKITCSTNYGSQDMVYFEVHEYTHIFRYSFIDAWINRDVWSDEDLSQACKSIIKRREQEDVDNPPKIHSTGKALNELRDWYLMEDEQVEEVLEKLVHEVEEGKYAYYDYSNILSTLLYLQVNGLFTGDIKKIQTKMIDMIKKDLDVQEENDFHKNFSSEEIRDKYNELYRPIAEERKIRNREINKEEQEESDIYRSADVFYEHCRKMANYYCIHKSFIEYLDLDKLLALINISNNEDIYTILQAFKTVYFMGNLKDFYMADVQGIKRIIEGVKDDDIVKQGGITRKIALSNFVESLKKDLILLGVEE
ncbi:P-loop NTPase fold protein [Agathobacter rectalis]|uniref:P-loop NTPase fold protein n=2 Tax=Agathobacter rectalis TaxID=39491 RepID=UPI0027D2D8CD|nr:P-loop NTPase fold protein [Agathobacter rectalis]MCB7111451.1 KAP family NTPase [Agathobacter rectalis]MCG4814640.1 KAP family NTPase [Agathobacter rectalis]